MGLALEMLTRSCLQILGPKWLQAVWFAFTQSFHNQKILVVNVVTIPHAHDGHADHPDKINTDKANAQKGIRAGRQLRYKNIPHGSCPPCNRVGCQPNKTALKKVTSQCILSVFKAVKRVILPAYPGCSQGVSHYLFQLFCQLDCLGHSAGSTRPLAVKASVRSRHVPHRPQGAGLSA